MDLPLEALAFRYSAALSGSAWPLLAVAFAAVGLWRIRTFGSKPSLLQNPIPAKAAPVPVSVSEKPTTEPVDNKLTVVGLPSYRHVESDGVRCDVGTKGRFTAYFYAESDGDSEEIDGVWEEEVPALGRWEEVRGDLGWYRYVDLTAIDGSVVRLWGRGGGVRRRGIGVEW